MNYRHGATTFDTEFNQLPINTNNEKENGCYSYLLNSIKNVMDSMINKHSKVLFLRFDLRFPDGQNYSKDNQLVKKFIYYFARNCKNMGIYLKYIWVRERSREKHQHYHLVVLLNGNKTQNIYGHLKLCEEIWAHVLNIHNAKGLVDYCIYNRNGDFQENGIMIIRNSSDFDKTYNRCFHWASYLAKINTKENISGVRNFGCSELR